MSDMYTNNIEFDTSPDIEKEGEGLWFLTPLSAIQMYFSYIV